MLSIELFNLIKQLQNNKYNNDRLEYSQEDNFNKLYKLFSSFSNSESGIIIFGLKKEKEKIKIIGVHDPVKLEKNILEQCKQMEPQVEGIFTCINYENKNICTFEIPEMEFHQKPCYYKGVGKINGSYIKIKNIDLFLLNKDTIDNYLNKKKVTIDKMKKVTEEKFYEIFNIKKNNNFTLATIMNFAFYPQGIFPHLGIKIMIIPGYSIEDIISLEENSIISKKIEGTISEMLEKTIIFCKNNEKIIMAKYPIIAIKEAIRNALIHRDYSIYTEGIPIQIIFFIDRVEIHSPGSLYGAVKIKEIEKIKFNFRNPFLVDIEKNLNERENCISGISVMKIEMKKYDLPDPEFKNEENEFIVTLYNEKGKKQLIYKNKILEFCSEPKSKKEILSFLNSSIKVSEGIFYKCIHQLLKEKKIAMTMPEIHTNRNQKYYKV